MLALIGAALAAWPADALYLTTQSGTLHRVPLTRDGSGVPSAGSLEPLATPGAGVSPGIVFLDGELLVAASDSGRVRAYDDTLAVRDYATGFAAAPLFGLANLAVSRDGDLYVSQASSPGFVFLVPPPGGAAPFEAVFDSGLGETVQPGPLAIDPVTGELWSGDYGAGALRRWDPATDTHGTPETGFGAPAGLALTCDGTMIVAEHFTRQVLEYDPDTNGRTVLFTTGDNPEQIAVDDQGWMYVGTNSGQIVRFQADGTNAVIANTGLDIDGLTWFDGSSDTSLAASCPEASCAYGPDTDVCEATVDAVATLSTVFPGTVHDAASNPRLRPQDLYDRLAAMVAHAEGLGCSARPLGVTAAGRYDASVVTGSADGTPLSGSYVSGTAQASFGGSSVNGRYNQAGHVRTRIDGATSLTGVWVRVQGQRGIWVTLETTCSAAQFNGWY